MKWQVLKFRQGTYLTHLISWTHLAEKHALKTYISQKSFEWGQTDLLWAFSSVFIIIVFKTDHDKIRTFNLQQVLNVILMLNTTFHYKKRQERYHNCFSTVLIKWIRKIINWEVEKTNRNDENINKKWLSFRSILE